MGTVTRDSTKAAVLRKDDLDAVVSQDPGESVSCGAICCGNPCDYVCATVALADVFPCPDLDLVTDGHDQLFQNSGDPNDSYDITLCDHNRFIDNATGIVYEEAYQFRDAFCGKVIRQWTVDGTLFRWADILVIEVDLSFNMFRLEAPWICQVQAWVFRVKWDCCGIIGPDDGGYIYCDTPPDDSWHGSEEGDDPNTSTVFTSTAIFRLCPKAAFTIFNQVSAFDGLGTFFWSGDNNWTGIDVTSPVTGEDQAHASSECESCEYADPLRFTTRNHNDDAGVGRYGTSTAASCVLSDPTGTFGIRRVDTLATVVAAGAAVVDEGDGKFSYAMASPPAGIQLEANFKIVDLFGATSYYAVYHASPSQKQNVFATSGSATIQFHPFSEGYDCPLIGDCPGCDEDDREFYQARKCSDGSLVSLYMGIGAASTVTAFQLADDSGYADDFPDCYYWNPTAVCVADGGTLIDLTDILEFASCATCGTCDEDCETCGDCLPFCPDEDPPGIVCRINYSIPGTGECGHCTQNPLTGYGCGQCCLNYDLCRGCEDNTSSLACICYAVPDEPSCRDVGGIWCCNLHCVSTGGEDGSNTSPCSRLHDDGGAVDLPLIAYTSTTMTFQDTFSTIPGRTLRLTVLFDCVTKQYTIMAEVGYAGIDDYCTASGSGEGTCDGFGGGLALPFTDTVNGHECSTGIDNGIIIGDVSLIRLKDCPERRLSGKRKTRRESKPGTRKSGAGTRAPAATKPSRNDGHVVGRTGRKVHVRKMRSHPRSGHGHSAGNRITNGRTAKRIAIAKAEASGRSRTRDSKRDRTRRQTLRATTLSAAVIRQAGFRPEEIKRLGGVPSASGLNFTFFGDAKGFPRLKKLGFVPRPAPRTTVEPTESMMNRLGPPLWAGLHWWGMNCDLSRVDEFLAQFTRRVPCGGCRTKWRRLIKKHPCPKTAQKSVFNWTVDRHNDVNADLGKKRFSRASAWNLWRVAVSSN